MADGEFKIEKGIPLPGPKGAAGNLTAALREMEVGDSLLIPPERVKGLSQTMTAAGHRVNRTFARRTTPDGMRLWRVA